MTSVLTDIECHSNTGATCIISALKILQALHIRRSVYLLACNETTIPRPHQPRISDSVLSVTKKVILLVSDMLKYACTSNTQVQLVLTIICGKLMAWYRAMVRDFYNSYENSSSMGQSVANDKTGQDDQPERISHQPITIGEYSFDAALEGKILAQVVSGELQHLERLVESLARRIQETSLAGIHRDKTMRG